MFRFTELQAAAILASRRAFNEDAAALQANIQRRGELVGNSIAIPVDAWRRIDQRAQLIARSRLAVFSRLAQASLIPVSIADLVNYYPQISDSNDVTVTMDGRNNGKADQANVSYVGTPVPVLSTAARFGWRQMAVMMKGGGGIDLATITNGQRKIAEKQEDMVLNGLPGVVVGGSTIYGLRTFPQRNTGNHTFTLATTATGANWLTAFTQAINLALGDNNFGKVTFFVNYGDYVAADTKDYAANYQGTILQRLKSINQVQDIIPASSIPANEIIGIADLDVGEWGGILQAMPLTTRPASRSDPEEDYVFQMMAACAPQLRADATTQSPFVHLSQ